LSRDLDVRIRRAQEEISDLGRDLLEVHQGMEKLLRLLESGAPGSAPAPLILEERIAHLEARLRRLEEAAGRAAAGQPSLLRKVAGGAWRAVRAAGKQAVRRAWRTLKLRQGPALPPAEWVFETRLVARPPVPSPAVTVLVTREGEGAVREWLGHQSLPDVEVFVVPPASGEGTEPRPEPRGRWLFFAPDAPAAVSPTFLEEHLWAAAAEDLVFTAEGEGRSARVVLARAALLDRQSLSLRFRDAEGSPEGRRVVGRSLPGSGAAGWVTIAVPPDTVSVGGLWVRRGAWRSGLPLERQLTPLDGLLGSADTPAAATGNGGIVAVVGRRCGWGGTVFARRLAEALGPEVPFVAFDADEEEPADGVAAYSAGMVLPPPLRLSALELVARRRHARAVVDLRWRPDPLFLARSLRLRHPELRVLGLSEDGRADGIGLPCLPPAGASAPVPTERRIAARARLAVPEGNVAVVLADTLDEDSGVFELLQAAATLEGPGGWTFLVGGNGPLRPVVSDLVASRRLASLRVATERLDDLLSAADLFCLPGTGPFRAQLLLEALARGVPALVSEQTARALDARDAVALVKERADGAALAAALVPLASVTAREELARRGLDAARSWIARNRPEERWREGLGGSGDSRP
jgi:glycosyltransferase involved in cell wall biosynthesis